MYESVYMIYFIYTLFNKEINMKNKEDVIVFMSYYNPIKLVFTPTIKYWIVKPNFFDLQDLEPEYIQVIEKHFWDLV